MGRIVFGIVERMLLPIVLLFLAAVLLGSGALESSHGPRTVHVQINTDGPMYQR